VAVQLRRRIESAVTAGVDICYPDARGIPQGLDARFAFRFLILY
jgi:hypothetical protein